MSQEFRYGIGPAGRWLIFAGMPWAGIALLIVCGQELGLDRTMGTKALAWMLYGAAAGIGVGGMVMYNYFPKRWVIPFGLAGWAFTFLLLCWYYWFGPGALKL